VKYFEYSPATGAPLAGSYDASTAPDRSVWAIRKRPRLRSTAS
jgi:hypothetical protein